MNLYLTTCNQLCHLVPDAVDRIHTYWPAQRGKITVLCYDKKPKVNCEVHCLGRQAEFGKSWTDALIPFFKALPDPYFVHWLDDYWLEEDVYQYGVNMLERFVKAGVADKADLTDDRAKFPHRDWGRIIVSDQNAAYRTSLQAAIWTKDYFLRYLKPARTAWNFELIGYREAFGDGATIIGTKTGVVKYRNVMLKGEEL